jgi:hypothetical protein
MNLQSLSEYDNNNKKGELIALLKTKTAVLMVGAGSSSIVGYPSWKRLLIELRDRFCRGLPDPYDCDDLSKYAQIIKDQVKKDNRDEEYQQFLYEKFEPFHDKKSHTPFHLSLVNLGFCGIVTTNYDRVLEIAIQASPENFQNPNNCESLNLCGKKQFAVFPFLRALNSETNHVSILHLHGFFGDPETIILTQKDYEKQYGLLDETDEISQRILDSLHRKVIWALLTTHPHLFVGFSLTDPFFLDMIKMVNIDFKIRNKCSHYAIMGFRDKIHLSQIIRDLTFLGICPIFYQIIINQDGTEDHRRLLDLVSEIENSLSTPPTQVKAEDKQRIIPEMDLNRPSTLLPIDDLNKITGGYG